MLAEAPVRNNKVIEGINRRPFPDVRSAINKFVEGPQIVRHSVGPDDMFSPDAWGEGSLLRVVRSVDEKGMPQHCDWVVVGKTSEDRTRLYKVLAANAEDFDTVHQPDLRNGNVWFSEAEADKHFYGDDIYGAMYGRLTAAAMMTKPVLRLDVMRRA